MISDYYSFKKKSHFSILSFYAHISNFDEIQWSFCNFFVCSSVLWFPKKSNPRSRDLSLFSSKRFMVLALTFRLLLDFELIFIESVR